MQAGFTLIEMVMAMAIFTIVAGATLSLFAKHQPIFNQQQSLAEVNIALRNAVAQMQLDIANAGADVYTGVNIPNYPVGITITNHPIASGGDCRSGTPLIYGANCFDGMSIITGDDATPPANPSNGSGAGVAMSATTLYLSPTGSTTYASAAAATAAAAHYKQNDELLLVKQDGSQYTAVKLSADGTTQTIGGNILVKLVHNATTGGSGCVDNSVSPTVTHTGCNTVASGNDPYGMTNYANSMLGDTYQPTDFALRLVPIQYSVDVTTDPTNPTLTRSAANVTQTTLANQIIGLKIGASIFNNSSGTGSTDTTTYNFDSSSYTLDGNSAQYNYTLVRSVMISLIGRTKPTTSPAYVFRNTFDNGAYEIQGVSVVVNPRNMSMAD